MHTTWRTRNTTTKAWLAEEAPLVFLLILLTLGFVAKNLESERVNRLDPFIITKVWRGTGYVLELRKGLMERVVGVGTAQQHVSCLRAAKALSFDLRGSPRGLPYAPTPFLSICVFQKIGAKL